MATGTKTFSQITQGGAYNASSDYVVTVRNGQDVLTNISSSASGVSSLNSLSGSLSIASSGGTITVAPSGSTVNLESVPIDPVVNTAFAIAVSNLSLPVLADYVFGSNAAPGPGQIAVHNSTDLGVYFNPYEINTGTVTTNSEWERYQLFSSAANFVFNSDNLALTGTLTAGTTATATNHSVIGSFTGSTNSFAGTDAGLSSTAGITVGQLMFQIFRGFYYVTSNDGTTITSTALYGSDTTLGPNLPLVFPPAYFALTNALSTAGSSTLHIAAVPSGVTAGQTIGFQTNNTTATSSQEYTVVSKTSTTVTITPVLAAADAVTNGQGIFFFPGIHSGQIWSKQAYNMPGQNGATYFAMELTCQLPQHANGYFDLSTANTNGAFGAWVAFWLRADYTLAPGNQDILSELDVFEFYANAFRTMSMWDTNVISANIQGSISGIPSIADFLQYPPLWNTVGVNQSLSPLYTYNSNTDYSQGVHKFQLLFTPNKEFIFIDGQMIMSRPWHWTSPTSPQLAVNLAIGSLIPGIGSNGQFPINDLNFQSMLMNIYELKVWGK